LGGKLASGSQIFESNAQVGWKNAEKTGKNPEKIKEIRRNWGKSAKMSAF